MDALAYVIPAQVAYLSIPATQLREFVDGIFPVLAKNPLADSFSGGWHRWAGGHDLLVDVFSTAKTKGVTEALNQAGHIVFTDFPTKAGIPIPGFSQSGLGKWLVETAGIHRGWLNLNICDAGISIITISEGSKDLIQAINGNLKMDSVWTFFDTYVEGTLEITIGCFSKKPLLIFAGIENVLAGTIATWNTIRFPIAVPDVFFGAALSSSIIGFAISVLLLKKTIPESLVNALKSGLIGAMFSINPACGFGVILGFGAYSVGKALAQGNNNVSISEQSLQYLLKEIKEGTPNVENILQIAKEQLFVIENNIFPEISPSEDILQTKTKDGDVFRDIFEKSILFPISDINDIFGKDETKDILKIEEDKMLFSPAHVFHI